MHFGKTSDYTKKQFQERTHPMEAKQVIHHRHEVTQNHRYYLGRDFHTAGFKAVFKP